MQIKILHKDDIKEKLKTRKLYEENFDIGDKDFVDYYYRTIIKRNEVVTMVDDNNIISMVHLNPYEYNICGNIKTIHYLVGIATKKEYRNKGYISKTLNFAIDYLNDLKEPFCFLVPENDSLEKFYNRFGFERVCKFNIDKFSREKYDIYPVNTDEYKQLMKKEQDFLLISTDEYKKELSEKNVIIKILDNNMNFTIEELKNKRIYVCQEV